MALSNSIVDYLKSTGSDSSYSARKRLAEQQGISNYTGTASQNTQLLNTLRNAASGTSGTSSSGSNAASANVLAGTGLSNANATTTATTNNTTTTPAATSTGSSSSSSSTVTRGYQPSERTESAYNAMKSYENGMPGDYTESEYVEEWRDKLNDIENSKPDDFTSKYESQISDLLNQIYGDKGFSYTASDLQNDDLYKMYSQQYAANASRSMRDTMGAAQAASGGYGSSYSQQVGQQAYDQTMSGLNDKVLDFWDRAYDVYKNTQSNRYNQLNAFQTQDNTDYSRYRDTVSDWQTDRAYALSGLQGEQSADINAYNATSSNYWNGANYYSDAYNNEKNSDFAAYQQDQTDAQWEKEYAMNKEAQDLQNQLTQLQIQQAQQKLTTGSSGSGSSGGSGKKSSSSKKTSSSKSSSSSTTTKPNISAYDLTDVLLNAAKKNSNVLSSDQTTPEEIYQVAKNNYNITPRLTDYSLTNQILKSKAK